MLCSSGLNPMYSTLCFCSRSLSKQSYAFSRNLAMDTGDHLQCQQPLFSLPNSWGISWCCWKLQCLYVSLTVFPSSLFLENMWKRDIFKSPTSGVTLNYPGFSHAVTEVLGFPAAKFRRLSRELTGVQYS